MLQRVLWQWELKISLSTWQVRRRLGYCPQFDALIEQLTGRETLTMYARLRGVQESQIAAIVENLIRALVLQQHADKLVASYRLRVFNRCIVSKAAIFSNPDVLLPSIPRCSDCLFWSVCNISYHVLLPGFVLQWWQQEEAQHCSVYGRRSSHPVLRWANNWCGPCRP